MFKKLQKIFLVLVALVCAASLMAACSTEAQEEPSATENESVSNEKPQETGQTETITEPMGSLPIVEEELILDYWAPLDSKAAQTCVSFNEVIAYQELEKRTGISINFLHPPVGQDAEQFNLMVSSGDLPDLIYYNWGNVAGGPAKYIEDEVILKLNDLMDEYAANLGDAFDKYPEARLQSQLDDGTFYMFPFVKPDSSIRTYYGPQFRKDWLDDLALDIPVTIDDWYNVLKAFKENDPNGNGEADEIPFVSLKLDSVKWLAGAWGLEVRMDTKRQTEFYQKDGEIRFAPLEDAYIEYLQEMRKWYVEGLIDPDFASTDETQLRAKVTGNKAGAWFGGASGYMGRFLNMMKEEQPAFDVTAVQYPAGAEEINYNTDPVCINSISGFGTAITTANENLEETVRWIDYQYGDEGTILMNFGIEGDSYTMVDGKPIYTDTIMNNPDLTPDVAVAQYATTFGGTILYDSGYYTQMMMLPQQKDALKIWGDGDFSLSIPPITPTSDESQRLAMIMNEINTYVDEMFVRYVMGQDNVDDFDEFRANLEKMNIEEAISIAQDALDRYNARK